MESKANLFQKGSYSGIFVDFLPDEVSGICDGCCYAIRRSLKFLEVESTNDVSATDLMTNFYILSRFFEKMTFMKQFKTCVSRYLDDARVDMGHHISPRGSEFVDFSFDAIARGFQTSDEDHRHGETSDDRQQHSHDKRQGQHGV